MTTPVIRNMIPERFLQFLQTCGIPYELNSSHGININGLQYKLSAGRVFNEDNSIDLDSGQNVFTNHIILTKDILDLIPRGWTVKCSAWGVRLTWPNGPLVRTVHALPEGFTDDLERMSGSMPWIQMAALGSLSLTYIYEITYHDNGRAISAPSALWKYCSPQNPPTIGFREGAKPTDLLSWRTGCFTPYSDRAYPPQSKGDQIMRDVFKHKDLPVSEFIEAMIDLGYEDIL